MMRETRSAFLSAYDQATHIYGVGWNLTDGTLLDSSVDVRNSGQTIANLYREKTNIQMERKGPKMRCSATDYLAVLDILEARFQEKSFPVHSFPELSLAARFFNG